MDSFSFFYVNILFCAIYMVEYVNTITYTIGVVVFGLLAEKDDPFSAFKRHFNFSSKQASRQALY